MYFTPFWSIYSLNFIGNWCQQITARIHLIFFSPTFSRIWQWQPSGQNICYLFYLLCCFIVDCWFDGINYLTYIFIFRCSITINIVVVFSIFSFQVTGFERYVWNVKYIGINKELLICMINFIFNCYVHSGFNWSWLSTVSYYLLPVNCHGFLGNILE